MKKVIAFLLFFIMISFVLLSLSACNTHKSTDAEKAENNNTNTTSPSNDDLENEPPFSLDAQPIDGKEYVGDGLTYVIYDDNSVEIVKYEGKQTEITIPSEIDDYPVSRIAASAFENCYFIKEVNIWADVIIIGESAFKDCIGLKEITIPHSVSEIYDSTFEGCSNLEEANIWGDVTRVGVNAFKNCISLKEITIPSSCLLVDQSAFEGCTAIEEVNLWGEGVIGECAFKNCTSLKEITIPSEITEVKKSAFEGCTSLTEVNVWGENVIFGVNVFTNCPKLKELPDGSYPDGVYNDDSSTTSENKEDASNSSNVTATADGEFTYTASSFIKRFEKAYEGVSSYNYTYQAKIDNDKLIIDETYYLYYRLQDKDNNYKDIGMVSFTKADDKTLPVIDEYTEGAFCQINILVEDIDDVPIVLVGAMCGADPSLDFTSAYNIGLEVVECAGTANGYTHNNINYVIATDDEYYYIVITPISN